MKSVRSDAAEAAISNPLLDEVSMKGASGVLINVTGGNDLKLFEVDEAARRITQGNRPRGSRHHRHRPRRFPRWRDAVSLVATGINMTEAASANPVRQRVEPAPRVVEHVAEPEAADVAEAGDAEEPRERFTAIEGGKSFETDVPTDDDSWSFGDQEEVVVAGHGDMEPSRTKGFDDSFTGVTPQVSEVENVPVSRKPSFIERMTGSMRGSTQRNRSREPAPDGVMDAYHHADGSRGGDGPTLLHDSFSNDDNLNIPSFLRRRE